MTNEPVDSGVVAAIIAVAGAIWGWVLLHFGLKDRVTILETKFVAVQEDLHKIDQKLDLLLGRKPQR